MLGFAPRSRQLSGSSTTMSTEERAQVSATDADSTQDVMAIDLLPGDVVLPDPCRFDESRKYRCRILLSRSRTWRKDDDPAVCREGDKMFGFHTEGMTVITMHWLTLLYPEGFQMVSGDFPPDATFNRLVSPARER